MTTPEEDTSNSKIHFTGGIPMIKFGEEFEKWDANHKISYLKKLASAMNESARVMQDERNAIATKITFYEKSLENANLQANQVKSIMTRTITDANLAKETYLKQIKELQYRVNTQDKVIATLNAQLENSKE